ncbi:MAG: hypothetical protein Q9196_004860 [Gyalolechia fulgens]
MIRASSSSANDSFPRWTTRTSNLTALICLSRPSSSPPRPALPPEIILQILSHPTRWLLTHAQSTSGIHVSNQEIPIVALPPLTAHEVKWLRRLVFRFRSKDQGFSWDRHNHGTYAGSWTWFEAALRGDGPMGTRDDPDLHVRTKWELQRNRHAGTQFEDYEVVFEHGDARMTELKAAMKEGDVVQLRACARQLKQQKY